MGIVDDDVVRVREATDIVALIGEHTSLRRVGHNWSGLCPFHAEKTPSFSVNGEKGVYYCFGCGKRGDAISFVREIDHTDFVGAVEHLAGRAGIALRYTEADEGEGRKHRKRLTDAVEAAVAWYHERLLSAPDAAKARSYLRSRGLDGEVVRQYRIGWAPEGWDELVRALRLPRELAVEAGLGFVNRRGGLNDVFRGRILFPIFDPQDRALGFGGRILPGGDGPKYKNSAQNAIYDKSAVLYGLNWAKSEVVNADEVVVCEGYTDVIGFAVAGVPRAVATCGTALTEAHMRLLRKYARRVVLAFDADAAGQAAADRFYAWERTHELDVAVADLPPGVDPGDLARSDPDRLRAAVEQALPFLGFRIERILGGGDLTAPEGRARVAEAALEAIAEHPSDLVRDQYVMEVASRTRSDPDRLREQLDRRLRTGRARPSPSPGPRRPEERDDDGDPGPRPPEEWDGDPGPGRADPRGARIPVDRGGRTRPSRRADSPETEALRLALGSPEVVLGCLSPAMFRDGVHLAAYRVLAEHGDFTAAVAAADPAAAELLHRLAVEDSQADLDDVVNLLLLRAATSALGELEVAARAAGDDPEAQRRALEETARLRLWKEDLQTGAPDVGTVEGLLAWLERESGERP